MGFLFAPQALPTELYPQIINCALVGLGGLEPSTSSLSVTRSNQLSYSPSDEQASQSKSNVIVAKQQSIRNKKPPFRAILSSHFGSAVIFVDFWTLSLPRKEKMNK